MTKTKLLSRFIVVILLCAFLTMSVGKVTRVSAVGTAIAAGSAAFIAVGLTFVAYVALTGGEVAIPVDNTTQWLDQIGKKVAQYPSGQEAYQYAYQHMISAPETQPLDDALDFVMPLARGFLERMTNDFSDIRIIQGIVSYVNYLDVSQIPTNGFTYSRAFVSCPANVIFDNYFYSVPMSFADYQQQNNSVITINTGPYIVKTVGNSYTIQPSGLAFEVRNILFSDGTYGMQKLVDGEWTTFSQLTREEFSPGTVVNTINNTTRYLSPMYNPDGSVYGYGVGSGGTLTGSHMLEPIFPMSDTYVDATGVVIPAIPIDTEEEVTTPRWPDVLDPDEEVEYPIVPYTQMPLDVYGGGNIPDPKWGFNLDDLLDLLLDLVDDVSHTLFNIGLLKELLNQIGGQSSGDDYIYYDYSENGDTYNNFNYLITNNYGDDNYITYDIDVSEVDEHLPVDLNTIQLYTDNSYIDSFKKSAQAGSSIIRDLVVFWYDTDPEFIYVIFGACIITLIAAFIGKWGHS